MTEPEVSRDEAIRRLAALQARDMPTDALEFAAAGYRTVVYLYDQLAAAGQHEAWQSDTIAELRQEVDLERLLVAEALVQAEAPLACVDRLRNGWRPVDVPAVGWSWWKAGQPTEAREPMTEAEQAVMAS